MIQLHNPNRWEICLTDASNVDKLIERAHLVGPTKEDMLDIMKRFEQHHSQFRAEFSSRLTDIRRSLLNLALPVSDESKPPEIARNATLECAKKNVRKRNKKLVKSKSKPTTRGLPGQRRFVETIFISFLETIVLLFTDLMDFGDIDSAENVKKKPTKVPKNTTVHVKTVKTAKARPQSAAISSTVTGERDFSEIKSPLARRILKRRLSTYEVPQPDPMPSGAGSMATRKRRVSHAAAYSPYNPDHSVVPAQSSVKLKREVTSAVSSAVKTGGDFHFGSDNDDDDSALSESNISLSGNLIPNKLIKLYFDCKYSTLFIEAAVASNEVVPSPSSGNISEIAKMVLNQLNSAQAAKLKNDAESDAKPIVEAPLSDDPFYH